MERNMPTYQILLSNTIRYRAIVEARNEEKAREKAENMDSSDLELEYSDPLEIDEIEEINHWRATILKMT